MDQDHVALGLTGKAKLGHTLDDTLGEVENGGAHVHGGFDGVQKHGYDSNLFDEDGKPRRTGCLSLSCYTCYALPLHLVFHLDICSLPDRDSTPLFQAESLED